VRAATRPSSGRAARAAEARTRSRLVTPARLDAVYAFESSAAHSNCGCLSVLFASPRRTERGLASGFALTADGEGVAGSFERVDCGPHLRRAAQSGDSAAVEARSEPGSRLLSCVASCEGPSGSVRSEGLGHRPAVNNQVCRLEVALAHSAVVVRAAGASSVMTWTYVPTWAAACAANSGTAR
jgi:hypothetical protein